MGLAASIWMETGRSAGWARARGVKAAMASTTASKPTVVFFISGLYRGRAVLFGGQALVHTFEPFLVGEGVGAEFFQGALFFAVDEGAIGAEFVGGGGIDEVAGVVGAHLEKDAVVEFAHGGAFERAVDARGGIDPSDDVDSQARAFAEEVGELLAGVGVLFFFARGEAEAFFSFFQDAITLNAVDDEEDFGAADADGAGLDFLAFGVFGGEFGDGVGGGAEIDDLYFVG